MNKSPKLTALIERENEVYVSFCPELDIASQGKTIEEAHHNLQEAVELFFEAASSSEIAERLPTEMYIAPLEVNIA
jgi:predicted RNase H-like HicB family nuclease